MRRTGPPCSVCAHPRRAEIDADARAQVRVAKKFHIAASTLQRHRANCTPSTPKATLPPPPHLTPERELESVETGMARFVQMMARAEAEELPKLVRGLQDLKKIRDELMKKREVTEEQVLASRWWAEFKSRMLDALRPYPDAARALVQALAEPK